MRLFVNAGFNNPLARVLWPKVNSIAHGIRTGPAVNDGYTEISVLVANALTVAPEAIFIVGGWDWRRPNGSLYQRRDFPLVERSGNLAIQCQRIVGMWQCMGRKDENLWIEFGNELDITPGWNKDLEDFYRAAMLSYAAVRELSSEVKFITGSTSNFDRKSWGCWRSPRGWETLKKLSQFDWPADTYQGLHPYRNDLTTDQWKSWKDWSEALDRLSYLLNYRKVAITEMGWSSRGKWSDLRIKDFVFREIFKWKDFGAGCYVHYQMQDAPRPNNRGEGGFGAYTSSADGLAEKYVRSALSFAKTELGF